MRAQGYEAMSMPVPAKAVSVTLGLKYVYNGDILRVYTSLNIRQVTDDKGNTWTDTGKHEWQTGRVMHATQVIVTIEVEPSESPAMIFLTNAPPTGKE